MKLLNLKTGDHPFLRDLSADHLRMLSACAGEAIFESGEVIFREGDIADKFCLVQSGEVALESHQVQHEDILIQRIGAGDVLGWSWLFPPFTWHFQARAISPTNAIVLNGAHLLIAFNENHDFGYEIMRRVTQVVLKRLQATRRKLLEKADAASIF